MSQEILPQICNIAQIENGGGSILVQYNNGESFSIEKPSDDSLIYGLNYQIFRYDKTGSFKEEIDENTQSILLDRIVDFRVRSNVPLPVIEGLAYIQTHSADPSNVWYWDCKIA